MYTSSCIILNSSAFSTQSVYVFSIILRINKIVSLRKIFLLILYNATVCMKCTFMRSLCKHQTSYYQTNARFIHQ
jgi:hypothetical protein